MNCCADRLNPPPYILAAGSAFAGIAALGIEFAAAVGGLAIGFSQFVPDKGLAEDICSFGANAIFAIFGFAATPELFALLGVVFLSGLNTMYSKAVCTRPS